MIKLHLNFRAYTFNLPTTGYWRGKVKLKYFDVDSNFWRTYHLSNTGKFFEYQILSNKVGDIFATEYLGILIWDDNKGMGLFYICLVSNLNIKIFDIKDRLVHLDYYNDH